MRNGLLSILFTNKSVQPFAPAPASTFLPYKAKEWFTNNEQLFSLVFVVLWITGIAGTIISPAINLVTTGILSLGKLIIG